MLILLPFTLWRERGLFDRKRRRFASRGLAADHHCDRSSARAAAPALRRGAGTGLLVAGAGEAAARLAGRSEVDLALPPNGPRRRAVVIGAGRALMALYFAWDDARLGRDEGWKLPHATEATVALALVMASAFVRRAALGKGRFGVLASLAWQRCSAGAGLELMVGRCCTCSAWQSRRRPLRRSCSGRG